MRKLHGVLAAAVLAASMTFAPAATAATEVGSNCAANGGAPEYTLMQLSQAGSSLPLTAPVAGIVTKWKVNAALVIPPEFTITEKMRVLRPTGAPDQFRTIAESSPEHVVSGANVFETRIPVQAGDRFGAYAGAGSAVLFCMTTSEDDVMGAKKADVGPGSTADYEQVKKIQLALSATIEPDADGDGFGDESQDKCPQSAALQAPCPTLLLEAFGLPPGKGSIRVLVAADTQSTITVSASAKVKGKKGVTKLVPVAQLVSPGKIVAYTLNFTKALKDALKALPKSKSIKLAVVAEGKSVAGAASTDGLSVKIKGQAKPQR